MIALQQYRTMWANYLLWMFDATKASAAKAVFVVFGTITLLVCAPAVVLAAPDDPTPAGGIDSYTTPKCDVANAIKPAAQTVSGNAYGALLPIGIVLFVTGVVCLLVALVIPKATSRGLRMTGGVIGIVLMAGALIGILRAATAGQQTCL